MKKNRRPTIVVTGDFLLDHNIYGGDRLSPSVTGLSATTSLTAKGRVGLLSR